MSGFVAGGNAEPFNLVNDGFFPDIDADDLCAALRLDSSISNARLEVAAVNAMLAVNRELAHYKASAQANGHAALSEVSDESIASERVLVRLYRRAVYCSTGAELAERYRSYDTTAIGETHAEQLTPSIDEYRRDARWAIRDLLGTGHATVELI